VSLEGKVIKKKRRKGKEKGKKQRKTKNGKGEEK